MGDSILILKNTKKEMRNFYRKEWFLMDSILRILSKEQSKIDQLLLHVLYNRKAEAVKTSAFLL